LGPTLAFMTAMPINAATIILAYGLLGPQIATIYLITGFVASIIAGIIGNAFAGPEIQIPSAEAHVEKTIWATRACCPSVALLFWLP